MRWMRRIGLAALATVALAACADSGVKAEDAYKIGCPAADAAVAGGSLVSKATVAGLRKLSESGQLDPEPQRWVDATVGLLDSSDPKGAPSDVKKIIIDGCAQNGYPLRNLAN